MQITLAQLDFIIGDFEGNTSKILTAVAEAKKVGSELICFSELSICGYPPRDFLEFEDFIRRCKLALEQIATHSHDIGIVLGVPVVNPQPEGKDLYNSAVFLYEGKILHTYHKCLLPTYDVFDEYRYFEPGNEFKIVEFKGKRIAITICEDIWNIGNENPLYINCPMDVLILQNPDFVLNLSASPFAWNHSVNRLNILRTNVERYKVPFFYVNQVGAQTEILFDGGSVVMSADAKVWDEMPYFESCVRHYQLAQVTSSQGPGEQVKDKITLIRQALVCGIKGYFEKLGLKKAILGLSGGIDSALTCALAVEALGAENVRGVMMPSSFSSGHSVDDAVSLAKNLGIRYDIVPIKSVYEPYLDLLNPLFEGKPFDVTEENIQARNRGMILMALSNKWGYILLNTTNKSEMAVGYGTLYGDMCGGLSVLGDVYKMEVYALAENINKEMELIPQNTISKPPSAELRPGQKDSDSLPPYPLLDEILYEYIELRQGPGDIIANGFDEATVRRVLKLVNTNEFKRHQTAPVLRVSSKAFGMGRRMPIVGKYLS
ncbi:MAG: NAD+ synthase [Saprospiraceae bacterium]|nr:NAD+ synthase [Saprospiraceae bacterium]